LKHKNIQILSLVQCQLLIRKTPKQLQWELKKVIKLVLM